MGKNWIRFPVFLVAGLAVGWGIRMLSLPRPVEWEKLPASPSPVIELLNICEGTIYVKTADDTMFQRTWGNNEQWSPVAPDTLCEGYTTITEGCDLSSKPFVATTHPPADIRACLQGFTQYPEGSRSEAYVLDSGQNVWRWHLFSYAGVSGENIIRAFLLTTAPLFCCPAAGALIALLSLWVQRRAPRVQSRRVG